MAEPASRADLEPDDPGPGTGRQLRSAPAMLGEPVPDCVPARHTTSTYCHPGIASAADGSRAESAIRRVFLPGYGSRDACASWRYSARAYKLPIVASILVLRVLFTIFRER